MKNKKLKKIKKISSFIVVLPFAFIVDLYLFIYGYILEQWWQYSDYIDDLEYERSKK